MIEPAFDRAYFLGAETSTDRITAVAACGDVDGRLLVNLLDQLPAEQAMDALQGLTSEPGVLGLVIDRRSDSATVAADLDRVGVAVTAADADMVAVAAGRFLDLLASGRLQHLDQPALTSAIRAARRRSLVRALVFRRDSDVDQAPLAAAALAVSAYVDWASSADVGAWVI
jgi:hypothetical protein